MNDLPPDFDENPEWTEVDFQAARPASEVLPPPVAAALVRRPPLDTIAAAVQAQRAGAVFARIAG